MDAGFVLILGMHRSGTSCLAGSLERCGLFLGDVSRRNRANARGNHESKSITRLNDRILADGGGDWRRPPAALRLGFLRRRAVRRQVDRLRRNAPCGVKDPRLLLVLEPWLEAAQPALVGSYRHPAAVAASLAARNQLTEAEALSLWRHYNAELVRRHESAAFPLVEFDLSDPDRYVAEVAHVAGQLGLEPDRAGIREFVSGSLSHHETAGDVPDACREIWEYLVRERLRL